MEFWPRKFTGLAPGVLLMPTPAQKPAKPAAVIEIGSIHSFLIRPGKGAENPDDINGAAVPKSGKLFEMVKPIFDGAEEECKHKIAFNPENGKQENGCRDALIAYIRNRDIHHGREIAKRLQSVTTHRSGLGLLFLVTGVTGEDNGEIKIVVSRFPADSGVLAEEKGKGLTVEFLERIFMKSAKSYKAAVYSGKSFVKDFWRGQAADKQINSAESVIADYWIREFLMSDFLTPGEAGTRRFAMAVRETMNRSTEPRVKQDIAAVHNFLVQMPAQTRLSAKGLLDRFHVPAETQEQIKERFPKAKSFDETFTFVPDEFAKFVSMRTIELDTGALLTAPTDRFDEVFTRERVASNGNEVFRFSTQGSIVDQRYRKVKP
jgi:hypothetical protein